MSSPRNDLKSNFKKAEESPGFLLWKASNLLQHRHARCLKDLAITTTQFSLMTCLVYLHQHGPVTPSMVAVHSGIDKMTISDLMKTLEKKGLLRKTSNPRDGRSVYIEPTPAGVKTTNSAVRKVEALDREFFEQIGNLPAFQTELRRLVQ